MDSLQKETCVGENCAKLRLSWPVASGPESAEKINLAIRDQMALLIQTGEDPAEFDSLVQRYFKSFEDFKSEFSDSHGGWEIEAEGKVSYESDSTLSIYFTQSSFLGGAHPNSTVSFMNFNANSGEFLSLDQLVLDEDSLLELAERKFKEFHEVAEVVSIQDDGRFFLPETGFFLPNAMGFKDGKFWIIYVPYEIGPYVMGYTELEFTPEELKGIVRW
ncbi:DUF3298 and DUF4163 domain-containing protein [Algoriphagus sp. A40]|uniref:DUF3298 and DUF4163 domain-containing protein n=1 Tax=Algoriphagus sp. A40 TaxID=1945863 RepID=UPI0014389A97|nr:DUF3298 and DUF4163 domain-containing protein [Algoriphagus sp. A40]